MPVVAHRYLRVSYRKGKAYAGYYYLAAIAPGGVKRSRKFGGSLVADYGAEGEPLGVEIINPGYVSLEEFNAVLRELGVEEVGLEEVAPVCAA